MERPKDKSEPGITCPQCGLSIKVVAPLIDKCPICGAILPVSQETKNGNVPGSNRPSPIFLEKALFKSPRAKESWTLREMLNVILLTYFLNMMVTLLVMQSVVDAEGNMILSPEAFFVSNILGLLVGFGPILYIILSRMPIIKLSFKKIAVTKWLVTIIGGVVFGFLIVLVDIVTGVINNQICTTTRWELFCPNQASVYIQGYISLGIGNELYMILPLAASQIFAEFFYRGTILNGLLQHYKKRTTTKKIRIIKMQSWIISVLLNTALDFGMSLSVSTVVFYILIHAIVGLLFLFTDNVQSAMLAQGVYFIMLLIL